MADWDFDLLGDPIPEGLGKRGRPPHIPTLENRRKVIVLAAVERTEEQIAAALSITPPTLRKYYFRELRSRVEARQRLEGKMLLALVNEIDKGKVGAVKELFKQLERLDLQKLGQRVADRGGERMPDKVGKKEALRQAAGKVHGKYAPPPAPRLIN